MKYNDLSNFSENLLLHKSEIRAISIRIRRTNLRASPKAPGEEKERAIWSLSLSRLSTTCRASWSGGEFFLLFSLVTL